MPSGRGLYLGVVGKAIGAGGHYNLSGIETLGYLHDVSGLCAGLHLSLVGTAILADHHYCHRFFRVLSSAAAGTVIAFSILRAVTLA